MNSEDRSDHNKPPIYIYIYIIYIYISFSLLLTIMRSSTTNNLLPVASLATAASPPLTSPRTRRDPARSCKARGPLFSYNPNIFHGKIYLVLIVYFLPFFCSFGLLMKLLEVLSSSSSSSSSSLSVSSWLCPSLSESLSAVGAACISSTLGVLLGV